MFPVLQRMDRKKPELLLTPQQESTGEKVAKGLQEFGKSMTDLAFKVADYKIKKSAHELDKQKAAHQMAIDAEKLNMEQEKLQLEEMKAYMSAQQASANVGYLTALTQRTEHELAVDTALHTKEMMDLQREAQKAEYRLRAMEAGLLPKLFDPTSPEYERLGKVDAFMTKAGKDPFDVIPDFNDYSDSITAEQSAEMRAIGTFSKSPQAQQYALSVHPEALWDKWMRIEIPVEVTTGNLDFMQQYQEHQAKKLGEEAPTEKLNPKQVVHMPFGTVLSYVKNGYMTEDFIKMLSRRDIDDTQVRKFLEREKFSKQSIENIMTKVGELRGVGGKDAGAEDTRLLPRSTLIGGQAPDIARPIDDRRVTSIEAKSGAVVEMPEYRGLTGWWKENIVDPIAREQVGNDMYVSVLNDAKVVAIDNPARYNVKNARRSDADYAQKVTNAYDSLVEQYNQISQDQKAYASMPGQSDRAKMLARVKAKLHEYISGFEKHHKLKPGGTPKAEPETDTARQLRSAVQGGGVSTDVRSFESEDEAVNSGLPDGTIVVINGKKFVLKR
mgnify:CR=1 FL=1